MAWQLVGEYFENCSCDVLCPCLTSSMLGPADTERCQVPLVCHVREGSLDDVSLDDLNFVMVVDSPAVMSEGGWRVALSVDERANEAQQQALGAILSGNLGGPPEMLAPLIGEMLGVKSVPIHFEWSPTRKRVEVPGIMEFEVESVTNPATGEVLEITNTIHPMGADLPVATSVKGVYNDPEFGFSFDNTGKNGHYREFAWQA